MNFTVLGEAGKDQVFLCLYCELQAHKAEIENLMSRKRNYHNDETNMCNLQLQNMVCSWAHATTSMT